MSDITYEKRAVDLLKDPETAAVVNATLAVAKSNREVDKSVKDFAAVLVKAIRETVSDQHPARWFCFNPPDERSIIVPADAVAEFVEHDIETDDTPGTTRVLLRDGREFVIEESIHDVIHSLHRRSAFNITTT